VEPSPIKLSSAVVIVRRAEMDDAEHIHRFVSALEEEEFDYGIFREMYFQNIKNEDTIYLVAVEGDEVIGYVSCHSQLLLHHLGRVYEIQELYVDTNHRNKKAGALLLKTLEEMISKSGYKSLEVTSNKKRLDAHRFYLDNGFQHSHFKFTKPKK